MIRRRHAALSHSELEEHLSAGPSARIAFLTAKAKSRTIAETLAALANAEGGIALLGVTQKGVVQKGADASAVAEQVVAAGLLAEPPLILPSPQTMETDAGPLVVVQVPPGLPHVYSLQGVYLTRTGAVNRPLTTVELRSLLLERGEAGYESQAVAGASLGDLDQARIERYLQQISLSPGEEMVQALLARGCVADSHLVASWEQSNEEAGQLAPTVAGLLLFGRDPQRFLRSAEIICVRYAGATMSDEFVRQDIAGVLADQIRQAEAFVSGNMRRGMKISGLAREESSEYPLAVVREAIVNAIAHRDYSVRGEGIRLLMFSDRLEVYSPGRLPGHVTLDNLKDERYSRNEAIVSVLSDMGYIERLGYGIDRMIAAMHEAGLAAPIFEETQAGFKVVLGSASADLVSPQPHQQPWAHLYLNERQEKALAHVQSNGRITNSDFQLLVPDVSVETIRRDLADLVEKNLLLRIGEKRATYYILK